MKYSPKTQSKAAELADLNNRLNDAIDQAKEADEEHGRFITAAAFDVANGGKKPARTLAEDGNSILTADVYRKAADILKVKIAAVNADLAELEKIDAKARAIEIEKDYRESCKVVVESLMVVSKEQKKLNVLAEEVYSLVAKYQAGGVNLVNEATAISSIDNHLTELHERIPGVFKDLGIQPGSWR